MHLNIQVTVDPTSTPPTAAGRPILSAGDLYVNTHATNTLWFYDGTTWRTAAPQELEQIGDVYLTNPTTDQHLVYSANAGGTGIAGWHNQDATQISGRQIPLEALMDVTVTSVAANNFLIRNTDNDAWINVTPAVVAGVLDEHISLENLGNVMTGTPNTGDLLRYNGSQWARVTDLGSD